jgi:hypothetical protein
LTAMPATEESAPKPWRWGGLGPGSSPFRRGRTKNLPRRSPGVPGGIVSADGQSAIIRRVSLDRHRRSLPAL